MGAPEVLMEGVVFGESPRWHDGRVWFSDWGANQVIALDADGSHEVVVTVRSFPMHRLPARRAAARRGLGTATAAAPRARRVAGPACRPFRDIGEAVER